MSVDALGNTFSTGIGEVGMAHESPYCYTGSYNKNGSVRWVSIFSNFDAAMGLAVAPDGLGGVATVGYTYAFGGTGVEQVMLTVKYNSSGGQVWSKTFVGTNTSGSPSANAVVQDTNGNVYVTGSVSNNGTGDDIVTIRYHGSTGAVDWVQTWNDPLNGSDKGVGIVFDGIGNVYVGGNAGSSTELLKYNASTGALIWASSGGGKSIATSGNNVYVATGGGIRQFNASTGAANWSTPVYGGVSQVAVDASGEVFCAGAYLFTGQPTSGVVTTRLNPTNGSVVWQKSYSGNGPDGLAVDGSGNVYVTSIVNGTNIVAAKYSGSSGTQLNTYTSPTYLSSTTNFGIGLDGQGDAFIVGLTPTPGTNNSESNVLAIGLLAF